jgi:ribosome-associated protein
LERRDVPGTILVTPSIVLDEAELEEVFVRSPGPGGQNVNKVSTAVQLRFPLARTTSLPEDVRRRLRGFAGRRVNSDGWLVIEASRFRSQARNRADARDRLVDLIRKAAHPPKARKPTRPTAGSKERRLKDKRSRGQAKAGRAKGDLEPD